MLAVMRLQMRQILSEKKFFFVVLLLAIPLALAAIIRIAGRPPEERVVLEFLVAFTLYFLYPQSVLVLLSLLYGTSIINAELEGKTLTYLFTRSIAKWKVVIAKYVAIVGCLFVPVLASVVTSWILLWAPGGFQFISGMALTCLAAVAVFSAIFAIIGTFVQRRPVIVGILYGMFETFLSFIPSMASSVTVTYFLRSLALRTMGLELGTLDKETMRILGDVSLPGASLVLLGMMFVSLFVCAYGASTREYVITEQV